MAAIRRAGKRSSKRQEIFRFRINDHERFLSVELDRRREKPKGRLDENRSMERTIYLDNNATTRIAPEVLEAMLPFLSDRYGNPSSIHRFGGLVRKNIDVAREQVAALLNAHPTEIYFTGCGSESDNTAIAGFCREHKNRARLLTSAVEHPAVRNCCRSLATEGVPFFEIGVDKNGMLRAEELNRAAIDRDTLASFMWANNETGVIFPIETLSERIKSKGGFFHTDAVQTAGKIPINLDTIPVDLLSLSGHKLHAPKGMGALFIRNKTKIAPLIIGGHQESGMRAGTENVAGIVALGKACEIALARIHEENSTVKWLRDKLESELLKTCKGARLNGDPKKRLPNTTNISFEFIEGEGILLLLDEKGIAASSGSACTTGSLQPSHVMMAMGIPYTLAHGSIRFSLSRFTTEAEIDAVIREMPPIIDRLRAISPYIK
jgi:cysteine desulfurase